jgi:hypothetical protein
VLALFVALGGTAIAAKHYVISSTGQIKPSVLKQLRGSSLGQIVRVQGPLVAVAPNSVNASEATCPSGYDVVSGGYSAVTGVGGYVNQNEAVSPHSWWAGVSTRLSAETAHVQAAALCAPVGQAVTVASAKAAAPRR